MAWIDRNFGKGSRQWREQMKTMEWGNLFGISSNMSSGEQQSSIRREVEAWRGTGPGAKDRNAPSLEGNFKELYKDDATKDVFYVYEGRINETYQEPPEDKRRVPASELLVGRITRSKPPTTFVWKGLIWKKAHA